MKMNSKILAVLMACLFNFTACSTTKDCTGDCSKRTMPESSVPDKKVAMELSKDITRPLALATKGPLIITKADNARSPAGDAISQEEYQNRFCMQFSNIDGNFVGSTIREMEATPYSVEDYFKTPACQPEGYSNVVKSPIAHIIADDPSKRVGFLDSIWLYYSKKRKDPTKFLEVVNAKNTEGETLLDYLETRKKNPIYARIMKEDIDKIIIVACSHGAIYSAYSDKKCP